MGEMELKSRITNFEHWEAYPWDNFQAYERSHNFHDVIDPDGLNIIDFMEISEDFAKIAGHMRLYMTDFKTVWRSLPFKRKRELTWVEVLSSLLRSHGFTSQSIGALMGEAQRLPSKRARTGYTRSSTQMGK
jgi:hypothetical protein